jgi:predicted lipoprotein with Yx(FWY)xxD motif
MKRLIPIGAVLGIVAVAALGVSLVRDGNAQTAQAGGGAYGGTGTGAPHPSAANSAVSTRSTPLGKILVDADGRTLYLFEADEANMSNCSGGCLSVWPALTAHSTPKAEQGVAAAMIGTTADGQVTYNGHPLYYYAGDQQAGDTAGQGLDQFGAKWYVLDAAGNKIDHE